MPCSICRQHGHNRLKCPQTTHHLACQTDSHIVTFVKDSLNLIDNVTDNVTNYSTNLTEYKPTSSHIVVYLSSHKESHCGYCSDNDGSIYSSDYEKPEIYITIPKELFDQLPMLEQHINDGYFNNYELSWHTQCYCGGNRIKNHVIRLDLIRC